MWGSSSTSREAEDQVARGAGAPVGVLRSRCTCAGRKRSSRTGSNREDQRVRSDVQVVVGGSHPSIAVSGMATSRMEQSPGRSRHEPRHEVLIYSIWTGDNVPKNRGVLLCRSQSWVGSGRRGWNRCRRVRYRHGGRRGGVRYEGRQCRHRGPTVDLQALKTARRIGGRWGRIP